MNYLCRLIGYILIAWIALNPFIGVASPSELTDKRISASSSHRHSDYKGERDKRGRIKRSSAAKQKFKNQTGYSNGRPGYQIDHIIPLACGGPDTPDNMQWLSIEAKRTKDRTERKSCR